jgi:acylaminoacyl-peptidase
VPTAEDLRIMHACSPIAHVHNVKTPTLTCVGTKDRRVPSSQGHEWHRTLTSMGVRSKLLVFPEDCHAIDLPNSEAEHFVAIRDWFAQDIGFVEK